jgi:hypothetical protein
LARKWHDLNPGGDTADADRLQSDIKLEVSQPAARLACDWVFKFG